MVVINCELFPNFFVGDFTPVHIMGVINLSPESFYKGSFIPVDSIKQKVQDFVKMGATFIDIGARSTAPGVAAISIEEEIERVTNAIQAIRETPINDFILSIDTQYRAVAEQAWKLTQDTRIRLMINDVSSFVNDPTLMDFVVEHQIPSTIMASKQKPGDTRTIEEIFLALSRTISTLQKKKYDISKLVIDPGVGKWIPEKTYEYDLCILDNIKEFTAFNAPILIGLSRKSFLGTVLNEPNPLNRNIGSLAATSIAVYNGAHIIRTHDVSLEMIQTIKTAEAIRRKPVISRLNNQSCMIQPSFTTTDAADRFLRSYGITPAGARIMKNKMIMKTIILRNVTAPQGLILKQELLARGGDVGLHASVITTENKKFDEIFDIILMGTQKQITNLIAKLKGQQLKLDLLAQLLENCLTQETNIKEIYSKDYPKIFKPDD
jgi:dihydropteroate synthase